MSIFSCDLEGDRPSAVASGVDFTKSTTVNAQERVPAFNEFSWEAFRVEATVFFVGEEENGQRAPRCLLGKNLGKRFHDCGHTRLVISAQNRVPTGGDHTLANDLGQLFGWNDRVVDRQVDVALNVGGVNDRDDLWVAARIGIGVNVRRQAEMLGILEAFGRGNSCENHSVRKDLWCDLDLVLNTEQKELFAEHARHDQLTLGCWPLIFWCFRIAFRMNSYVTKEPSRCRWITRLLHCTPLVG